MFPEYNWLPWKFSGGTPKNYWTDQKNVQKYTKWIESELGIKKMSDWYNVSATDIKQVGGESLLVKNNTSIVHLLENMYPQFQWEPYRFKYNSVLWDEVLRGRIEHTL